MEEKIVTIINMILENGMKAKKDKRRNA